VTAVRELPEFRLETYFARWEFAARHHLTASDAQTMALTELLDLADDDARERWDTLHLGYTETSGLPALREAVASTYDRVGAEDVLCFAGAEEAIHVAMHALLGPDDHAVVLTPNYQAAESIPLSICEVTGVALRPEDGWALDLTAIEAALRPNTRIVSVNFPNNPTAPSQMPRRGARSSRCARSGACGCSATRCTEALNVMRHYRRPPTSRPPRCR
jgi:aspartate/methionine/tyrosine aminotransferase